jgi:hypothetical protein
MAENRMGVVADLIKDYISLDSITQYHQTTGVEDSDFKPIFTERFEGSIFAIDGSNTLILDLAAVKLNLIRAGYVVYRGTRWQKTEIWDKFFIADQIRYAQQFQRDLGEVFGLEESFRLEETELDRLSTYFRELQEYVAIYQALEEAKRGDLILYDGGFAFWKERPYGEVLDLISERGEEKGVDLLGISKSSTLSWGGGLSRPFVQNTNHVGSHVLPDRSWCLDLEGKEVNPRPESSPWKGKIYVVKFHPQAERAFRVDAPLYVVNYLDQALGRAAGHSDSAECPGYPHALFRAHREIRITDQEGSLVRRSLLDELGGRGIDEEQIRGFLDYHGILEMQQGRML